MCVFGIVSIKASGVLKGEVLASCSGSILTKYFCRQQTNQKNAEQQKTKNESKNLVAHALSLVKIGPVNAMMGHLSESEGLLSAVSSRLVEARIIKLLAVQESQRFSEKRRKIKREESKQGLTLQRGGRCGRAGALRGSSSR